MFKAAKLRKNFFACNELIKNGMYKRRKLAYAAIYNICHTEQKLRIVK